MYAAVSAASAFKMYPCTHCKAFPCSMMPKHWQALSTMQSCRKCGCICVHEQANSLKSSPELQFCSCRDQTKILLGKHFNSSLQEVLTTDRLIFGDYLVPGADPRVYTQVTDMERLVKVCFIIHNMPELHCFKHPHIAMQPCLKNTLSQHTDTINSCKAVNCSTLPDHWIFIRTGPRITRVSAFYSVSPLYFSA